MARVTLTENCHARLLRLFEASLVTVPFERDPRAKAAAVNAEIGRQLAAVGRLYADYCHRLRLPPADCPPAALPAQLGVELAPATAELIATESDPTARRGEATAPASGQAGELGQAAPRHLQRAPGVVHQLAQGFAALRTGDRAAARRSFAMASLMARDGAGPSREEHERADALAFARAYLVDPTQPARRGRPVWRADDRLVGLAEIAELQRRGDMLGALSRADEVISGFVATPPLSFERYGSYKIVRFEGRYFGIPDQVRDFHFIDGVACRLPLTGGRSRYALPRWIFVIARHVIPVVRRLDHRGRIEALARRLVRRVAVLATAVPGVKAAPTLRELLILIESPPKL